VVPKNKLQTEQRALLGHRAADEEYSSRIAALHAIMLLFIFAILIPLSAPKQRALRRAMLVYLPSE
jgi:hypothetical protein